MAPTVHVVGNAQCGPHGYLFYLFLMRTVSEEYAPKLL
jgi:hypothetical protein